MWCQFIQRELLLVNEKRWWCQRASSQADSEKRRNSQISREGGNWVWSPVGLTAVRRTHIIHDPNDTRAGVRFRLYLPLDVGSRCGWLKFLPSVARAARQQVTQLREREKDKRWKRLSLLSLSPSLSLSLSPLSLYLSLTHSHLTHPITTGIENLRTFSLSLSLSFCFSLSWKWLMFAKCLSSIIITTTSSINTTTIFIIIIIINIIIMASTDQYITLSNIIYMWYIMSWTLSLNSWLRNIILIHDQL